MIAAKHILGSPMPPLPLPKSLMLFSFWPLFQRTRQDLFSNIYSSPSNRIIRYVPVVDFLLFFKLSIHKFIGFVYFCSFGQDFFSDCISIFAKGAELFQTQAKKYLHTTYHTLHTYHKKDLHSPGFLMPLKFFSSNYFCFPFPL